MFKNCGLKLSLLRLDFFRKGPGKVLIAGSERTPNVSNPNDRGYYKKRDPEKTRQLSAKLSRSFEKNDPGRGNTAEFKNRPGKRAVSVIIYNKDLKGQPA